MEELILRSLQGRATPEEEARLQQWREHAPENDREYRALAELWSLLEVAAPSHPRSPASGEVEEPLARGHGGAARVRTISAPQVAAPRAGLRVRSGKHPWIRPLAAGLLAASLGILGFGLGMRFRSMDHEQGIPFTELITGEGERTTFTLSDGTAVRLGPKSTLRVVEGGAEPVLWLKGRAYFGVVPDSSRLFTVRTEYGDAVALGTRFEVRADEKEFRVLVVEGNVRVSTAGATVQMGEGLMSRSAGLAPPSTVKVADVFEQLEWIGSTLVFRATPLARVVSEIEHRYGIDVELEDRSLEDMTITATFTDRPVDEVVFVICQAVRAGCSVEDGRFMIGGSALESQGRRPLMPPR